MMICEGCLVYALDIYLWKDDVFTPVRYDQIAFQKKRTIKFIESGIPCTYNSPRSTNYISYKVFEHHAGVVTSQSTIRRVLITSMQ